MPQGDSSPDAAFIGKPIATRTFAKEIAPFAKRGEMARSRILARPGHCNYY